MDPNAPPPPAAYQQPAYQPAAYQPVPTQNPQGPPLPERHTQAGGAQQAYAAPPQQGMNAQQAYAAPPPQGMNAQQAYVAPPPPQRAPQFGGDEDPNGLHYTRDPHKLTAYLVPFPPPTLKETTAAQQLPPRFLIYTPPAPPIGAPPEGEKEGKVHKVQRKWQDEVRQAKTTDAKVTSWKGAKGRVTKGVDWAMGQTKSSSLEFLNRIPGKSSEPEHDKHSDDGVVEADTTKKTVGLEELVLIYPSSLPGTQEQIREEFVNSMLRTKTKAQKDAVIATGLIPVTFAIDVLATLIWPFGGLAEIDTVWAVASMRGAKTARSVTKRLNSSTPGATGDGSTASGGGGIGSKLSGMMKNVQHKGGDGAAAENEHQLKLTFIPSPRIEVLDKYLAGECHQRDAKLFKSPGVAPTESDVVTAIGWAPSQTGGETKNWEDEQWELQEVKDDVKQVMKKGAREWDKWCKAYEKDPQKALKK